LRAYFVTSSLEAGREKTKMAHPYEAAIRITGENGVSAMLAVITSGLLGAQAEVNRLQKGFAALKPAIIGAGLALAGLGITKGMISIAEHGEKLLDQHDKLRRAGLEQNEILRLQANFYDNIAKSLPTATASEYLKTYNELRSVVGAERAEEYTPWSMKFEAVLANATGKSAEGEAFKLWRAIEQRGTTITDPAGSRKLAEVLGQDIFGSAGKLDADTFQTMAKRAGVAWINATPEFLAGPMANVASDLGGNAAGTALMSAYMALSGATTLSKQQGALLEKAGMLDMSKVTKTGFGGSTYQMEPGALLGSLEYTGKGKFDLYKWVQNVLAPHLKAAAMGGEAGNIGNILESVGLEKMKGLKMDEEQQATYDSYVAKAGRNRNVMRMFTMFSDPDFIATINKDVGLWRKSKLVEGAYEGYTNENPLGVKKAFNKQYESMMEAIGSPLMQAAIPVMKSVTEFFTSIGSWANAHQTAVKVIGVGLTTLGVGLTALATVLACIMHRLDRYAMHAAAFA
jgi:hypothetical protein